MHSVPSALFDRCTACGAGADSSKEAMLLLLDLVYTGSTARSVTLDGGVGAFELAHRWEVQHRATHSALGTLLCTQCTLHSLKRAPCVA